MNRTVEDATFKAFHYPDLEALQVQVVAFITAYNFAKHLKAPPWRTPFQALRDAWAKDPAIFKINPHHLIPRPHSIRHAQPERMTWDTAPAISRRGHFGG
jgi:hypothetical protein